MGYSVEVFEIGKGPHVLLVHGLGVSRWSMEKLATSLAEAGYHALLPDIPGQGTTARDKRQNYSIDSQARYLKRLLDRRNITKAIVIGNSMGGHIAASLALLHPEKVRKLILISPAGLQNGGPRPYSTIVIPEDLDDKKKEDLKWNNHIRKDIRAGKHYPIDRFLRKVRVPTLIVWGEKDEILPVDQAAVWKRLVPSSKLIRLEEMGHLPQDEDPAKFMETVQKFMSE